MIEDLKYVSGKLVNLQIEKCKNIEHFCDIQYLESLEVLRLLDCGDIPTICFIQKLKNLKCFSFVGSNVVDGNLDFCEGIDVVSFIDKKHYSHKINTLRNVN
ncbi:hypothetical protein ACIGHG_18340 [Bacillus sp. NPDC077411]|uniref:hypothetical protein n=1 Tax=Bacillus sp. NPDC077411 TaxID=3363947 RepID=UPI0037C5397B